MPLRPLTLKLPVALAGAALVASSLAGCSWIERGLDCASTAATIAGEVQDVQNVGQDPRAIVRELREVESALSDLKAKTDDANVEQSITELQAAVEKARTQAEAGKVPDLQPVVRAAGNLTKVCATG